MKDITGYQSVRQQLLQISRNPLPEYDPPVQRLEDAARGVRTVSVVAEDHVNKLQWFVGKVKEFFIIGLS